MKAKGTEMAIDKVYWERRSNKNDCLDRIIGRVVFGDFRTKRSEDGPNFRNVSEMRFKNKNPILGFQ
jgi:hypothetical protein